MTTGTIADPGPRTRHRNALGHINEALANGQFAVRLPYDVEVWADTGWKWDFTDVGRQRPARAVIRGLQVERHLLRELHRLSRSTTWLQSRRPTPVAKDSGGGSGFSGDDPRRSCGWPADRNPSHRSGLAGCCGHDSRCARDHVGHSIDCFAGTPGADHRHGYS